MTEAVKLGPRAVKKFSADLKRFAGAAAYWRRQIAVHGPSQYAEDSVSYWQNKLLKQLTMLVPEHEAAPTAEVLIKLSEIIQQHKLPKTYAAVAP